MKVQSCTNNPKEQKPGLFRAVKPGYCFCGLAILVLLGGTFAFIYSMGSQQYERVVEAPPTRDRPIYAHVGLQTPFVMLEPDGTVDGYIVDLTKAIARVMGVQIVILSTPYCNNPNDLVGLSRSDVILCMISDSTFSDSYSVSEPHAMHSFSLFGRKNGPRLGNIEQWRGQKMALNKDGYYYNSILTEAEKTAVTAEADAEDAMRAVAHGKQDFAIMETWLGNAIIHNLNLDNVRSLGEMKQTIQYAFAVKKGNEEVLRVFTEGLKALHELGEYTQIQNKWLEERFMLTREHRNMLLYGLSAAILLILGIMLVFFIYSRLLEKRVRQRTAELRSEIKEREQAEEELLRSQGMLIHAGKMAAVGTMAAGIAHEINNPNGLILLNLEFMRDALKAFKRLADEKTAAGEEPFIGGLAYSSVREGIDAMLDDTVCASRRIGAIVEDIKSFSLPDKADLSEEVDINAAAESAVRLTRSVVKKFCRRLKVELAPGLPVILGSARQIEQVIVNLILNACQALTDFEQEIVVNTGYENSGNSVLCRVADQGSGMDERTLARIFDPFYTTRRDRGGTGLGLSISAAIVKEHNGVMRYESAPGKGTVASLYFPAKLKL